MESPFDDEDDSDFPLIFHEPLGDHILSDDVRLAIVWASVQKFLANTELMRQVNESEFTPKQQQLAKSVVFHGPWLQYGAATEYAQQRQGVVVATEFEWTEEEQPVWVACLAN